MNQDEPVDSAFSNNLSRLQMSLIGQLYQSVVTMNHVDELFQWLAFAIAQRFNIQLIQFWTNQINQAGRLAVQLRTVAHQDPSLPEQIIANDQVSYIAQRVISERRHYKSQPVESIFTPYQTTLLRRYGLNHYGVWFVSSNAFLPPADGIFAYERAPTHLAMAVLLFVRSSPHPDVLPAIGALLEQAMSIAENRGLLLSSPVNPNFPITPQPMTQYSPLPGVQFTPQPGTPFPSQPGYAFPQQPGTPFPSQPGTPFPSQPGYVSPQQPGTPFPSQPGGAQLTPPLQQPAQQRNAFPLEQLIPHRKQDADVMLSSNPFSNSTIISDKKARRLHAAIDGQTNVVDLCSVTGMSIKEVITALQKLLELQRIELYEPNGGPTTLPPFR